VCLILFALQADARFPLVVAANRDESFDRPTAVAAEWEDVPGLVAGRDLEQGGTWLGVTRTGRFAALTNVRQAGSFRAEARSRGNLVADFLRGTESPAAYTSRVHGNGHAFNGFNLLVGSARAIRYCSNRVETPVAVVPGIHGLSNAHLDTPWPKVVRGRDALQSVLAGPADVLVERLFDLLSDRLAAPDAALPHTGVGLQRERELSPLFISGGHYGTRCSTVVLFDRDGRIHFHEKTWDAGGIEHETVRFRLEAAASSRG
jgi:uncharacterized protein with NRDE domain